MANHVETNPDGSITVSFTFRPGGSMLECERGLQAAANEALSAATGECLRRFDADGLPLILGGLRFTCKGRLPKIYQSPYGAVSVERHVYQGPKGGTTFCPMEQDARIFRTATPLFARQCAMKYASTDSSDSVKDFAEHGRFITRSYVREVGSDVALVASTKEEAWTYVPPQAPPGKQVHTVSVGVDGACMLMGKDGWRQAMVGTIALYDGEGERLHTTYVAAAPEGGKAAFFGRMDAELAVTRGFYPEVRYAGIADGAPDHWPWLEANTDWQALDFWHASEYVNAASTAMGSSEGARRAWAEAACHNLKHEDGAAAALVAEMETRLASGVRAKAVRESLEKAITYFTNNAHRMNYAFHVAMGMPIGSGVTEAACKCVVKARMCGTGMRWDSKGAAEVLRLRAMTKTEGRWEQFWDRVSRHGFARITVPKRNRKRK